MPIVAAPSSRLFRAHRDDGNDILIEQVKTQNQIYVFTVVFNNIPLYDTGYVPTQEAEQRCTQQVAYARIIGRIEERANGSHTYHVISTHFRDVSALELLRVGEFHASSDDIIVASLATVDPANTLLGSEDFPTLSLKYHDHGTRNRMTIANAASIVYCYTGNHNVCLDLQHMFLLHSFK